METVHARDEPVDATPWDGDHVAVIIGAGLSGVAVAHQLRRRGITDFVVLERSDGVGGTWWDNRYPGAGCDLSSDLYSYSFHPGRFDRTHARQPALQAYVEEVVGASGITANLRLGVSVRTVTWDEPAQRWLVCAADGRRWRARFVASAVGQLNEPFVPAWAGPGAFRGPCFHTARWEDHDLHGATVAVVGTGSTSAQLVPALVGEVGRLVVYQREPGWVMPKPERMYTDDEQRELAGSGIRRRLRRLRMLINIDRGKRVNTAGSAANRAAEQRAREYLAGAIADPALRESLTPTHPYFGKRVVRSTDFYAALDAGTVELVPHAVTSLTATGIVDASGTERAVDAVILATGFRASELLCTFDVVGPDGRTLREVWGAEPRAFLGLMVPDFPNLFMLYGPNTNGGDVLFTLECQAEWIARAIRRAGRDGSTLTVRRRLFEHLDRKVVARNETTAWARSSNYFKAPTGRIVTQWPYPQLLYWFLLRVLDSRVACTRRT